MNLQKESCATGGGGGGVAIRVGIGAGVLYGYRDTYEEELELARAIALSLGETGSPVVQHPVPVQIPVQIPPASDQPATACCFAPTAKPNPHKTTAPISGRESGGSDQEDSEEGDKKLDPQVF